MKRQQRRPQDKSPNKGYPRLSPHHCSGETRPSRQRSSISSPLMPPARAVNTKAGEGQKRLRVAEVTLKRTLQVIFTKESKVLKDEQCFHSWQCLDLD